MRSSLITTLTATVAIVAAGILVVVSRNIPLPPREVTKVIEAPPVPPLEEAPEPTPSTTTVTTQTTTTLATTTVTSTSFQGPVGTPHIKGPTSNPPNY